MGFREGVANFKNVANVGSTGKAAYVSSLEERRVHTILIFREETLQEAEGEGQRQ